MAYLQGVQEVRGAERIRTAVCAPGTDLDKNQPQQSALSEPDEVGVVAESRGTSGEARRSAGTGDSRTPSLYPSGSESVRMIS